jgi:hypothetical protein
MSHNVVLILAHLISKKISYSNVANNAMDLPAIFSCATGSTNSLSDFSWALTRLKLSLFQNSGTLKLSHIC